MKILLSIVVNSLILFTIAYFLGENPIKGLEAGIKLGCGDCEYNSMSAIKIYLLGGIILGLINLTIKPILKIVSVPLFFLFLGLTVFIINGVVLFLLDYILTDILIIEGIGYHINGIVEFIIATIIFTALNMVYNLLVFKK